MALSFGIEIELLVCPRSNPKLRGYMNQAGWDQRVGSVNSKYESDAIKKQRTQNRFALRYALATILSAAAIPATPRQIADYQSWSIVDKESLDEIPQYWRIEIVSRVLSTNIDWQKELRILFRVLHAECKLRLITGCSMHVHVSPYDDRYTADHLRKICKALCYFDNAITRVMPAERKNNPWATSNVSGRGVAVNQKLKKAYSLVPAQSWKYLFELFDKTVTPKHVYQLLSGNYEGRYISWNFENVTRPCGTVEFRRPSGADSAAKAIHWAAFTLGFVARALATDWAPFVSLKTMGSVADLEQFIIQGLQKLGPTSQFAALGRRIIEDTSAPTVLTPGKLSAIERKKKNKDKVKSPFVEKASSRPNTPTLEFGESRGEF